MEPLKLLVIASAAVAFGYVLGRIDHAGQHSPSPAPIEPDPPAAATAGLPWAFTGWRVSVLSDYQPDCAGVVAPPLPTTTADCAPVHDGESAFDCSGWRIEVMGVHQRAGTSDGAFASRSMPGSSGDPCRVVWHADARRLP
jgi:hypothetical protein